MGTARNALRLHRLAHAVLGGDARGQPESQVGRAEHQRRGQQPARRQRHAEADGEQHRQQQRHGIDRVDDEHGGPAFGDERQRPEQLRPVDREGVQHGMGHQHQP
jgi:hypothetical protein